MQIYTSINSLLGEIFCMVIFIGKLVIVYSDVPTSNNGQPISDLYFKLCMQSYTSSYLTLFQFGIEIV